MSLWAEYVSERLNWSVIESEDSFVAYSFSPPVVKIEDIYVRPHLRKTHVATKLLDEVVEIAKAQPDINVLWTQVWAGEESDRSLKACLRYGFKVLTTDSGRIILGKDIVR